MRIAAIWLGALLLAVFSGFHALSNISANTTLAAIFPANGLAFAAAAENSFRQGIVSNNGALPEKVDTATLALAQRAFETEPFSDKAIRIIALGKASEGKLEIGRNIMRNLSRLTKRDQVANFWLIGDYATLGDIDKLLTFYDISLRSSRVASGQLLPAMAAAMENRDFVEPFVDLLSKQPPWSEAFWSQLLTAEASYSNTVELRTRLAKKNLKPSRAVDQQLVAQMVRTGFFEDAIAMRDIITSEATESGEVLTNGNFQQAPVYPPLDWELFAGGKHVANIDSSANELIIDTLPGARGVVARQLIVLAPGQYMLSSKLAGAKPSGTEIRVQLRCAQGRKNDILSTIFINGIEEYQAIDVSDENCRFFWFELDVAVSNDGLRSEIVFDKIALSKAS